MTAQSKKTTQKRLYSCVLAHAKWPRIHERIEKRACGTVKISDLVADTTLRVENTNENSQGRHKTKLLGKYRIMNHSNREL